MDEPVEGSSRGGAVMAGIMCAVMAASFLGARQLVREHFFIVGGLYSVCASMVVDETNSLLSVDEIDKVTVLRMNKEFMEFMRREYPEVTTLNSSHGKYGTVVTMAHAQENMPGGW